MGRHRQTQLAILGDDRDFAGIRSFRSGSHGTACCGEIPPARSCIDPARFFDCLSGIAVSYTSRTGREAHKPFKTTKMFYDLNVPYNSDDPEISHTLNFLAESTSLARVPTADSPAFKTT